MKNRFLIAPVITNENYTKDESVFQTSYSVNHRDGTLTG